MLGVFGTLSLLGYNLDPVTVAALLMSIGLSVDFVAHTTSHFQRHRANAPDTIECIRRALDAIAWPMLQSATSTILCVAPLLFSYAYTAHVFFVTICLVVAIGFAHGIVIVPCVFVFFAWLRGERSTTAKRAVNQLVTPPPPPPPSHDAEIAKVPLPDIDEHQDDDAFKSAAPTNNHKFEGEWTRL